MANNIIPALLMLMFPLDLVAGLAKGTYPSQATLMSLLGALLGFYLARKLWRGGAEQLEAASRLDVLNRQGPAFDPDSEEAQVYLENVRLNYLLGAGLLIFGLLLNLFFIITYLITEAMNVTPSLTGQLVQIAVIVLFNLMVTGVEAFGARIFLKR